MLRSTESRLLHKVIQAIKEDNKQVFETTIEELQPYDLAQLYVNFPVSDRNKYLSYLSLDQLAELIQALTNKDQLEVLKALSVEKTSQVLERMDNDDLVSLLSDLEPDKIKKLLAGMKQEASDMIQNLMKYPPETAGRIMNNQYVWTMKSYTVREAVDKLKHFAELAEYLNYLYVIDDQKRLVGVVSYRDLLLADSI